MNLARAIIKEVGGRFQNAAGTINSDSNMFAGSSGNAPSDKLMGGANNNPIADTNEGTEEQETTETVETQTPDAQEASSNIGDASETSEDVMVGSDEKLKLTEPPKEENKTKGMLKNLDLDPGSQKPVTANGGGGAGIGQMTSMFKGLMGNMGGGEGAEGAGDMGADAGDMADMGDAADAASDKRLKNIFGDNIDAIRAFAKIDAIKFVYNEKAHEAYPNGEHQIDYDPHYGVKAQDLADNPLTASCVEKDNNGYMAVNTPELTMANSAVISEICKRIEIIEKVLGIKVV